MNKKFGVPVAALIAVGVVIAALAGALIATALTGDDEEEAVVLTTTATPASSVTDSDDVDADDVDPVVDRDDQPLTPAEADRVARAALRIAGGGTVTELGRSDDPGEAYEVEVQTEAGEIDIALDENLNRVSNNPYDD